MTDTLQTETSEQDSRILFVPLNKLKKSPNNARKVPHGEAAIEALAASIQHKGLIQNIVIEPEIKDGEPTGCYLITAGKGHRLAYLLRAKRKGIRVTMAFAVTSRRRFCCPMRTRPAAGGSRRARRAPPRSTGGAKSGLLQAFPAGHGGWTTRGT